VDTLKNEQYITILTKQPSVIERFCEENGITATIHEWKLGGPSFKIQNTKYKIQNDSDGSAVANKVGNSGSSNN
jgi:hypothetical protein